MALSEELTIVLKMRDQAKGALNQAGKGIDRYKKQLLGAGAGITAMGAGVEALARKQAPLLEATRKLAIQTGISAKELTGMATELSNATFPLDEVIGLMDQASKQGLEGADALQKYANFWDTVGDATGLSSQQLAKSAAALTAVGVEIGNESSLLGAFGLITSQTSGTVGDFLKTVERLAPEMGRMGLSVDDAASIMTALEKELGLTAKTARAEFKIAMEEASRGSADVAERVKNLEGSLAGVEKAFVSGAISQASYDDQVNVLNMSIAREKERLDESKGSLAAVLKTLGLTEVQVAKYTAQLEQSTGVIQANADAHASTKTPMEQLQSQFSDLTFKLAPMVSGLAQVAPLMLAIGPATMALSAAKTIYTTVTGLATTATTLFGVALKVAMGPIGLIIIAIGLLVAAGILIWKNWDTISAKAKEIWGFLLGFFQDVWDKIKSIFSDHWKAILGILFPPVGIALLIQENWGAIVKIVTNIWDRVTQIITGAIDSIMSKISGVMSAISSVRSAASSVTSLGRFIPGREHGGSVAAGQAVIVGERRPELFVPNRSGTIIPRLGGGGGGVTVNGPLVSLTGNVMGGDMVDIIETALVELQRRTGIILRTA